MKYKHNARSTPLIWLWLCCILCLLPVSAFAQQAKTEEKLSSVKNEIKKAKLSIEQKAQQLQALQQQLKASDIAIATSAKKLRTTQANLVQTRTAIAQAQQELDKLNNKKKQQSDALSGQLKAAYSTGQHDYIKMLLNQKDAGTVQRNITYYQYLNNARMQQIDVFEQTITDIKKVTAQQQARAAELNILLADQQAQQNQLKQEQNTRKTTLTQINASIDTSKKRLAQLEQQEKNLQETIVKMQQEAARRAIAENNTIELTGLAKLRKRLNWPTKGKIRYSFGKQKQGHLRWKGVLLTAPVGRTVTTIYQGRVLFADWLKGYGLVTVIDHGKGYMSLYGHNQTLLKKVGDIVETGEPVALVGQSGGQNYPGLYFEIRHKGKAVNPKLWCKN